MAAHRVGRRVTAIGTNERMKNTFDTVGASMTFMDDTGQPMGEPKKNPATLRTKYFY